MRSEPDQIKIWDQASYGNIWKLRNRQKPESAKLLKLRICMGSWEPQWNTQDLSPIRLKRDRSESMQSLLHWCTEKQRHCKVPAVDKESDHWNLSMDQTSEQSDACWVWSLLNQCQEVWQEDEEVASFLCWDNFASLRGLVTGRWTFWEKENFLSLGLQPCKTFGTVFWVLERKWSPKSSSHWTHVTTLFYHVKNKGNWLSAECPHCVVDSYISRH